MYHLKPIFFTIIWWIKPFKDAKKHNNSESSLWRILFQNEIKVNFHGNLRESNFMVLFQRWKALSKVKIFFDFFCKSGSYMYSVNFNDLSKLNRTE